MIPSIVSLFPFFSLSLNLVRYRTWYLQSCIPVVTSDLAFCKYYRVPVRTLNITTVPDKCEVLRVPGNQVVPPGYECTSTYEINSRNSLAIPSLRNNNLPMYLVYRNWLNLRTYHTHWSFVFGGQPRPTIPKLLTTTTALAISIIFWSSHGIHKCTLGRAGKH